MTTTTSRPTTATHWHPARRTSALRRIFGVVIEPQSYKNIGYLLLGLPLGTLWFAMLVTGLAVSVSLLVVALLGIPLLVGFWYMTRAFANVERYATNSLLGTELGVAPWGSSARGNLWARLRTMSRERDRWREFGFLMARFPAGIATFTAAVTALATPVLVAYTPFTARYGGDRPFGNWAGSTRLEDAASSGWAWLLVPAGLALLVGSLHLMNRLASACGRWASASLRVEESAAPTLTR